MPPRVVDMYNNEDVNNELHDRLPRSDRSYRPSSLSPNRLAASPDRLAVPGNRLGASPDRFGGSSDRLGVPGDRLTVPVNQAAVPTDMSGGLLLSSNVTGAPLVLTPVSMPFGDASSKRATDRDESRQISTLINELEALREDNRRVRDWLERDDC